MIWQRIWQLGGQCKTRIIRNFWVVQDSGFNVLLQIGAEDGIGGLCIFRRVIRIAC